MLQGERDDRGDRTPIRGSGAPGSGATLESQPRGTRMVTMQDGFGSRAEAPADARTSAWRRRDWLSRICAGVARKWPLSLALDDVGRQWAMGDGRWAMEGDG